MVNVVRNAIESRYEGKCTITNKETKRVNGVTKTEDVVYCKDQPCRLSYKTTDAGEQSETINSTFQMIKLFISPEVEVKEGAKISVTQHGVTKEYQRASSPMVYTNHQEIVLDVYKKA